ncbi:MAG: transcriptional regulator, AraC family [Thermoleophilia bacterium]|nr:transcriptional regulator, AraC family [Thermoleophilia bacterium]MCZ4496102.1 transcriptional regulator, AraC family [Thermoleophilia bacterium]
MSDIALQYLKPIWVAALRHRGPHDPGVADATWQDLIIWASPRGLLGRSPDARGVGLLWDDPRQFSPQQRRYDVGVPILPEDVENVAGPGFVVVTAPGRYLCATHVGHYERLTQTYAEVIEGPLKNDGWTLLAQPIVEVYRNSPSEVPEEELRTDIYFPVAKL